MTLTTSRLAPALAGLRPPPDDGPALRQVAVRLASVGHRDERAAEQLGRVVVELRRRWRGTGAAAAMAELEQLRVQVLEVADACSRAADVLIGCASRLDDAQATWRRAEALARQDEQERAVRAAALLRGAFASPYDVDGSGLRRQARRLADEAHAEAGAATMRAALQLREIADLAFDDGTSDRRRLTAAEQVAGFGRGAVDAVWDALVTVAGLTTPRMLIDRDGWFEQVRAMRDGASYAAAHPREAGLAAAGWDLLQEGRYGEWAGGLLPDLAGGVLSGGTLPAGRRGAALADDLAELGENVEDLQRVHGRRVPESMRGGPVMPLPGAKMAERYPTVVKDMSESRRRHILDGDPPDADGKISGGHRAGTGNPGKSEFPADWTDDKILRAVMETALHPRRTTDQRPDFTTLAAIGKHDGVTIKVIVDPEGRVVTAFPMRGPGVVRNPHLKEVS